MDRIISLFAAFVAAASLSASAYASGPVADEGAAGEAVATVNGRAISGRLLDKVVEQVAAQGQGTDAGVRRELLDKIIDLELVSQQAEKAGMDKDEAFVMGLDMYKKQQLFAVYLQKTIVEKTSVPEDEARAYYDANMEQFRSEEQVRASHILCDTEEKAAEVKKRLDAGGEFEKLAKDESTCPSSARGGDLGYFARKTMVPEFEDAAFAMKEGEVSGPVKTQFGYHIIKLTGRTAAGTKPFDEVKAQIEQDLLQKKQQKAYEDLLAKLRGEAAIEIKDEGLKEAPAPAPAPAAENGQGRP